MTQVLHCVVKRIFEGDKKWDEGRAFIVSAHTSLSDATQAAYDEYQALSRLETTVFAEWFMVSGLLRSKHNSCRVYVTSKEVEID